MPWGTLFGRQEDDDDYAERFRHAQLELIRQRENQLRATAAPYAAEQIAQQHAAARAQQNADHLGQAAGRATQQNTPAYVGYRPGMMGTPVYNYGVTNARPTPSVHELIYKLCSDLDYGVTSITVSIGIYESLIQHLTRYTHDDRYRGMTSLELQTPKGPMKIVREGSEKSFSSDEFDRYLEDVNETCP